MGADDFRERGDENCQSKLDNRSEKEKSVSLANRSKETRSRRGGKRDVRSKSRSTRKSIKHNRRKAKDSLSEKQSHLVNQSKRSRKSTNAFINFLQDYKKDYPNMVMNRNVFQMCSERWKNMSDEEKQPYIEAANSVKNQKRISEISEQPSKKISVTRVSKRKNEAKKKSTIQKRSKVNKADAKSNLDTDTSTAIMH